MEKLIVSACLLGANCQYDGKNSFSKDILSLLENKQIIAICPEILGGLKVPRSACNIVGSEAKVIGADGADYTKEFILGAKKVLEIVKENKIEIAYLKQRSPSCGCGEIYSPDGKTLIKGNGILAELLLANGVEVRSL